MVSDKGKQPAGKSSGKRKVDDDKTGGAKKRRNRGVLQFLEDAAVASDGDYSSGDSIFDDDFFEEEEYDLGTNDKNDQSKSHSLPVFPKEEEFEEEFDKMMEERYKNASAFLRFAEDEPDLRRFVEEDASIPSIKDPTTWKVKCAVGRERNSAFCLMQKYVDLQALGKKLQIISAYAVEHMKGHFFVEAEKQSEVIEACKGLCSIYTTRVTPVPRSQVPHLLNVRSRRAEISVGMWARVKNGTYKGDLAQVVAVNDAKRRVTVKLIPRIDLQALAQKF
ncbi:hypothetical protein CRG98_004886 [Punica granatum]|uniref:Uncharacterized protein n=1 Tax=Punica granatum TaxID=22663 RepID=A0A2I0L1I2_PUNGR|nr:hypothetical protein CRG98_004886 [Punica granatum]